MKSFGAGLAAAYAADTATIAACLRVLRRDGVVELFTGHDTDIVVGGETYIAAVGLDISNLVAQAGLAVDNMELSVFPDEISYPQSDILAGQWDSASFWLFECDYTADLRAGVAVGSAHRTDVNILKRGTTGEANTLRVTNKFEFRSLKQSLQQPIAAVTSKTCRARLGDELCRVDLTPWTHDYALTAVASRHVFTASTATEVDDYYGEGIITFLTGSNAGYAQKIKAFAAGVFTLSLSMPFAVDIGDTVRVVAGCRKRLSEDCKTKFNNVLNFQGEPHVPGNDVLTADPNVGGG